MQEELQRMIQKAEAGDSETQLKLGIMYYEGVDVPIDYGQAFNWFSKAAKQGDVKAQEYHDCICQIDQKCIQDKRANLAKGDMTCKYCGRTFATGSVCEQDCSLKDLCLECHNEIHHQIVKKTDGRGNSRTGSQEDWSDDFNDGGAEFWEDHYSKFESE